MLKCIRLYYGKSRKSIHKNAFLALLEIKEEKGKNFIPQKNL